MPLVPMGCVVQVHKSSNKCLIWGCIVYGLYLSTSEKHYQCHVVYIKKSCSEYISDTVHFQHTHMMQPVVMHMDVIAKGLQDLMHAIRGTTITNGK